MWMELLAADTNKTPSWTSKGFPDPTLKTTQQQFRLWTQHFSSSELLVFWSRPRCCWPTQHCHVCPQKQPAHRSSRQETPRAHSNRNSPPTSPPSLPLELCRPGSIAPASLCSRIGGRDQVNIWLLVHCRLYAFSSSALTLCATTGMENCTHLLQEPVPLTECD